MALATLCRCTCSSEYSLLAKAIRTNVLRTGLNNDLKERKRKKYDKNFVSMLSFLCGAIDCIVVFDLGIFGLTR